MDQALEILQNLTGAGAYLLVFVVLLLCGLGLPVPEDITLIAGGMLVYYDNARLWIMIVVAFIGVLFGDFIIFFLGRNYGPRLLKKGIFRKILHAERLGLVQKKLHDQGTKVIFFARFMPGLRAPIYFTCGTLKLPLRTFLFYDGLAAMISVPTIILVTVYFGGEIDRVIRIVRRVEHGIALAISVVVFSIILKALWNRYRAKSQK